MADQNPVARLEVLESLPAYIEDTVSALLAERIAVNLLNPSSGDVIRPHRSVNLLWQEVRPLSWSEAEPSHVTRQFFDTNLHPAGIWSVRTNMVPYGKTPQEAAVLHGYTFAAFDTNTGWSALALKPGAIPFSWARYSWQETEFGAEDHDAIGRIVRESDLLAGILQHFSSPKDFDEAVLHYLLAMDDDTLMYQDFHGLREHGRFNDLSPPDYAQNILLGNIGILLAHKEDQQALADAQSEPGPAGLVPARLPFGPL